MKFILPFISKEKAKETLCRKGFLSRLLTGKVNIMRLELFNVPHYSFEMIVTTRKGEHRITVSVDGIKGTFAFLNSKGIKIQEEGKPACDFIITPEEARKIARNKYSEAVIHSGLIIKSTAEIKEMKTPDRLYYPYWVGYYKKGNFYDFGAVDGLSGEKTGMRLTPVLMEIIRGGKLRKNL